MGLLLSRYRAILLGLALVPINVYFLLYMEMAMLGAHPVPSTISLFANCIFFLIALTLINRLLTSFAPSWALKRGELLVVYVMLVIATSIVSIDFLDVLIPMMVYPFRAATPENGWADTMLPHIPKWLSVSDPVAVKGWFEGNTTLCCRENLIPWLVPVAAWSGVILVMLFVMFCINTIVRRQWMEHDRLQFPLVELPMQLTEPKMRLLRSKLMWMGFAVAGGLSLLNGLGALFPSVPTLNVKMWDIATLFTTKPWNAIGWTPVSLYPYVIGLGFLLPVDMLFSCWFFFIMWRVIRILGAVYGAYDVTPSFPYMNQQALGAYYLIGVFALWSGRKHLKHVIRAAFTHTKDTDEAEGPMSYRTAVLGVVAGTLAVMAFFHYAGIGWLIAIAAVGLYFFVALAIARMHAEFGPPAHDLHYMGPEMVITGAVGTHALSASDLTGLSWFWWFNRAYRSIPIAYQLDGLKIAQRSGTSQRYMAVAIGVASVAAVISGFWIYLHFGYSRGAGTGMAWGARNFGIEAWVYHADNWMRNPTAPDIPATLAIGWGGLFAYFLYMMKLRVPWWPFHPLGFAVSTSYSIGTMWLPLMIAWAAKLITLRMGGLKSYRVALDFFLGLVIGDFIVGMLWSLIGWAFGISTYSFMQ